MTIEQQERELDKLNGKLFIVRDTKQQYLITKIGRDSIRVDYYPVGSVKTHGVHSADTTLRNINSGLWQVIEDKNMVVTTSKGKVWGVGSTFRGSVSVGGTLYTISKIDNGNCTITWTETYGKRDTTFTTDYISRKFDEGVWVLVSSPGVTTTNVTINTVDPNKVVFDFTNTKIKVANAAESSWVQQAAFANGFRWIGNQSVAARHTDSQCLYFALKTITQTTKEGTGSINHFRDSVKTEITIADIVGTKVAPAIVAPEVPAGHEIVGYVLLKELPGIPAGIQTTEKNNVGFRFACGEVGNTFTTAQLADRNWFKPITKAKITTVDISAEAGKSVKRRAFVTNEYIDLAGERLSHEGMKEIHDTMMAYSKSLSRANKTKVFPVVIESISVGCQTLTRNDVKLLWNAVQVYK